MKAVLVSIYRSPDLGDCTGYGLSSKIKRAWLLCEGSDDEFVDFIQKQKCFPILQLRLVKRTLFGRNADYIEPFLKNRDGVQMFGGNFAYSSDSRFRDYTGSGQPIAIHDRFEKVCQN